MGRGIVDGDTLVSAAVESSGIPSEFWPDRFPTGKIAMKSCQISSDYYSGDAKSEQDFVATYFDTLTAPSYVMQDMIEGRPHEPLNLEVTQNSYAWSADYVDDFIIMEYRLKNIGPGPLEQCYFGIYLEPMITGDAALADDLTGFLESSSDLGCGNIDHLNLAFAIDNDGDPDDILNPTAFVPSSPLGAFGVVPLGLLDTVKVNYNWWRTGCYG